MKRITYVGIAAVILAGMLCPSAGAQSEPLGDYARQVRKEKKDPPEAVKKYDNDNLPVNDQLSVVGNASDDTAAPGGEKPAEGEQGSSDAAKSPSRPTEVTPGQSPEDRQKAYDEWQKKIATQKNQVDLLARELDVAQREYRLRAAAFYADAGNRLRNAGSWDKEDAQYKQQIAQKQKSLDAAKQQLSDLQEQARKSGVPTSMRQ